MKSLLVFTLSTNNKIQWRNGKTDRESFKQITFIFFFTISLGNILVFRVCYLNVHLKVCVQMSMLFLTALYDQSVN